MSPFKKAQRKQARLRLALCGPSGSGKTYSALLLAKGLGGKVAMIDTERGSGELYDHLTDYDVAPLSAPFEPERYVQLIREAEKGGYTTIIIDSLTHAWAAEGGVLEMVDKATAASRSKNSYMAWREATPHHNRLVDAMLQSSCHIIVTIRTKTAYDLVDEGGKKRPVKVGMAPVQRDGLEYEFTVVLDLSIDKHVATASKDRTGLFDGQHFVPTPATGETLAAWLNGGAPSDMDPADYSEPNDTTPPSQQQLGGLKDDLETAARKKPEQEAGEAVAGELSDTEAAKELMFAEYTDRWADAHDNKKPAKAKREAVLRTLYGSLSDVDPSIKGRSHKEKYMFAVQLLSQGRVDLETGIPFAKDTTA